MDDAFRGVAETALHSGWQPEEVATALVELADNFMLFVLASRRFEENFAVLKRGRP